MNWETGVGGGGAAVGLESTWAATLSESVARGSSL